MTPAERYIEALRQLAVETSDVPFHPHAVNPDREEMLLFNTFYVEMYTIPNMPNWVHLAHVHVDCPGQGISAKGAEAVDRLAEEYQIVMFGKLQSYLKIPPEKLHKWYASFTKRYRPIYKEGNLQWRPLKGMSFEYLKEETKKIDSKTMRRITRNIYDYDMKIFWKRRIIAILMFILVVSLALILI